MPASSAPKVFRHPMDWGTFIIFEPGHARLSVRDDESFGLIIKQHTGAGPETRIQYGNDQQGYNLYIQLLKFLIATRQKVPVFRRSKKEVFQPNSNVELRIERELNRPYPASHQMDMDSTGTISPVTWGHYQRGLMMSQDGEPPIFLSGETIPILVRVINQIYKQNSIFREINETMRKPEIMRSVRPLHFQPALRRTFPKPKRKKR